MANGETALPNFFLVGAPKAGTTSLYDHLGQHPEIYVSPLKEVNYFSTEVRPERMASALQRGAKQDSDSLRAYLDGPQLEPRFSGMVTEWADYRRLFAGARYQRAIGEGSVCYLWSKTAAERIASCVPDAKILIVLRNPVDRAFSQYLHNLHNGDIRYSFRKHLEAALKCNKDGPFSVLHPFLALGMYAEQVRRYTCCFPASQIGLWLYEDRSRPEFLREVYEFLGADGGFVPDTAKRYLENQISVVPGLGFVSQNRFAGRVLRRIAPAPLRQWARGRLYARSSTMKMMRRERDLLIEYYREDVRQLESIVERDLSAWLK
jgi:hypothetical protein